MSKDQLLGMFILLVAIGVIGVYGWLIYYNTTLALSIVATIAVVGVMGIVAWIGWTMATTPAPAPIEALEDDLEKKNTDEKKE